MAASLLGGVAEVSSSRADSAEVQTRREVPAVETDTRQSDIVNPVRESVSDSRSFTRELGDRSTELSDRSTDRGDRTIRAARDLALPEAALILDAKSSDAVLSDWQGEPARELIETFVSFVQSDSLASSSGDLDSRQASIAHTDFRPSLNEASGNLLRDEIANDSLIELVPSRETEVQPQTADEDEKPWEIAESTVEQIDAIARDDDAPAIATRDSIVEDTEDFDGGLIALSTSALPTTGLDLRHSHSAIAIRADMGLWSHFEIAVSANYDQVPQTATTLVSVASSDELTVEADEPAEAMASLPITIPVGVVVVSLMAYAEFTTAVSTRTLRRLRSLGFQPGYDLVIGPRLEA